MTVSEVKAILINRYAKEDDKLSTFDINMRNSIMYCENGSWELKNNVSEKVLGKAIYAVFGAVKDYRKEMEKELAEKARKVENATKKYIFSVGEKFDNLKVEVLSSKGFDSAYGVTFLNRFQTEEGDIIVWWTTKSFEVGSKLILKGTVKEHKEYNSEPQTVVTRCKVEMVKDASIDEIKSDAYNIIVKHVHDDTFKVDDDYFEMSRVIRDELNTKYDNIEVHKLMKEFRDMLAKYFDSDEYAIYSLI